MKINSTNNQIGKTRAASCYDSKGMNSLEQGTHILSLVRLPAPCHTSHQCLHQEKQGKTLEGAFPRQRSCKQHHNAYVTVFLFSNLCCWQTDRHNQLLNPTRPTLPWTDNLGGFTTHICQGFIQKSCPPPPPPLPPLKEALCNMNRHSVKNFLQSGIFDFPWTRHHLDMRLQVNLGHTGAHV